MGLEDEVVERIGLGGWRGDDGGLEVIGEGRESMKETRDVLAKQRGREGRRRTRSANLVERQPERCFDFYPLIERGLYYDEDAVLTSLAAEILPPAWMKMPSRA